jgi:hypothetical protein
VDLILWSDCSEQTRDVDPNRSRKVADAPACVGLDGLRVILF